nr:hypothetical protein [Halolamina rubra]
MLALERARERLRERLPVVVVDVHRRGRAVAELLGADLGDHLTLQRVGGTRPEVEVVVVELGDRRRRRRRRAADRLVRDEHLLGDLHGDARGRRPRDRREPVVDQRLRAGDAGLRVRLGVLLLDVERELGLALELGRGQDRPVTDRPAEIAEVARQRHEDALLDRPGTPVPAETAGDTDGTCRSDAFQHVASCY